MPPIRPIWSEPFQATSTYARRSGTASLVNFIREFELWRRHWDCQPVPIPGVAVIKGTLRQSVPATRVEEADELLMLAVQTCTQKTMLTLDAGASPNARGSHSKKAAVQWVVERRCAALLRTFLELGVSLDTHMTLLASAVQNKHHSMEMAALLLEKGMSVDSHRTKQGRNALGVAVVLGHTAMVRYLVSKGADINLQNLYDGRAAVHHVVCTHVDCKRMLAFPFTMTPISAPPAVFTSCNTDMIETLVSLGANLTLTCTRQMGCERGLREHREEIMAKRRLAYCMALHARLGAGTLANGLDEEVTRLVLRDATPYGGLL
jgi:hypothetical protein